MAVDPDFDKVSLLLHMDGADGSTVFTDSSAAPKAVTAIGDAKISTAQGLFGGASGYFDGNGDALSVANSTELDFGTGDFTIECWVYIAGNSLPNADGELGAALVSSWGASSISGYILALQGSASTTGTGIQFDSWSAGNTTAGTFYRATTTVTKNAWHHIAATVQGGVRKLFLDGVQLSGTQSTFAAAYSAFETFGRPLCVGGTFNANYPVRLNGHLRDLRIAKGLARYTANFTPPTEAFPNSAADPVKSAYAAAATPLGAPAVRAGAALAARIAAPTPLGAAQALAEFNGTSKVRASAASPLGQPTAVAVAVMQARAGAATPLGAVQARAYSPPMGKAAAPTPLGAAQVTAYAMVAGYAASPTPLGQPSALAFADMEALGTVGQNTTFGAPAVVLAYRVQDGIRLAEFIPPLTALQGMAPGSMAAQASSLPSPAFGTPAVQFATSHEAASLESVVAFGAPAVRSIHPADSFAPVQFGDVGAPAFAAHAASLQDGAQFGQPLAFTLHALPDWYAGLRFGAVAVQGAGVLPVLDGIELGAFGQPALGATRHTAMPLHMLPQFGPVTISRGAMTC